MDTNRTLFLVLVGGLLLTAPLLFTSPPPRPATAPKAKVVSGVPGTTSAKPAAHAEGSASRAPERIATIDTEHYRAEVSSRNAGVKHWALKDARYHDGVPIDIVTTDRAEYYPLAVELDGVDLAGADGWRVDESSTRSVRLGLEADGVALSRKVEAGATPYQIWLTTRIRNTGPTPRKLRLHVSTYHYVARASEDKGVPLLPVQSAEISHALCKHGTDLEREPRDGLAGGGAFSDGFRGHQHPGPIAFAGVENTYFLSGIASESEPADRCRIAASSRGRDAAGDALGTLFSARVSQKEITLAPGAGVQYRAMAYLGPKVPEDLAAAGHSLGESIQTGWFTSLAEGLTWLLREFHRLLGNWGLAIIVLTFVVKTVLFPLTWKQIQSMAKMKALKPEIDRINERFADDREKKGAAMMELYRKKGINPMAGCFPVLLQLPIWFSLYQSLATNVELFRAPFALWWQDLSGPDPYFVLPLALGVLMYVQQKITPVAGMDPVQAKMMLYMMPTMITAFMLFLPAGLCLYMFTNSALSILQQRVIEKHVNRMTSPPTADSGGESAPGAGAPRDADVSGAERARASSSKRRSRRGA
jgi:YidC/Oxa1 family membrane protein insertase